MEEFEEKKIKWTAVYLVVIAALIVQVIIFYQLTNYFK
jgi:hypothetical protein